MYFSNYKCRDFECGTVRSNCRIHGPSTLQTPLNCHQESSSQENDNGLNDCMGSHVHWHHCPELQRAFHGVQYIADYTKREEDSNRVRAFKKDYWFQ